MRPVQRTEMKTLQQELLEIEPKRDFLHELCGCGMYAEITQTSDGFFLGRAHGDCGFNVFLGKPSEVALKRAQGYLERLSNVNREKALDLLDSVGLLRIIPR